MVGREGGEERASVRTYKSVEILLLPFLSFRSERDDLDVVVSNCYSTFASFTPCSLALFLSSTLTNSTTIP